MFADLDQTAHRPYPLPEGPGRPGIVGGGRMVWHDLLFMHWPVPAAALRPHIPAGLTIDTFTGGGWVDQAFLAVVPFWMSGVRAHFLPPAPTARTFPELNVRTYVRAPAPVDRVGQEPRGRGGVYFFSLDAASRLAVAVARATFHLRYMRARMTCGSTPVADGGASWITYASERTHRGEAPAVFRGRYRPVGAVSPPARASLEDFLTGRYCLYAACPDGRILRGEIHHGPWPLQLAEAEVEANTMGEQIGVDLGEGRGKPLLHFAKRLEVVAWRPRPVAAPVTPAENPRLSVETA